MDGSLQLNRDKEHYCWRRVYNIRAKLRSSSTTSHLFCTFAMMAATELQVNSPDDSTVPDWLWVLYLTCTVALATLHIFAITISTYLLPQIDAMTSLEDINLLQVSPLERFGSFIELAYFTSRVVGLLLFLIQFEILCWVKFWDFSMNAAKVGGVVVAVAFVLSILFGLRCHLNLSRLVVESTIKDLQNLEDMRAQLNHSISLTQVEQEQYF